MENEHVTLEELARRWKDAKRHEDEARKFRVGVEEEIIAMTGCKEEGSTTTEAGEYKIRVTGKLTRKLDVNKWREIEHTIPEKLRPVDYVPKLDLAGLRYLENNEPETFAQIAVAIETKPAKTAVEVK